MSEWTEKTAATYIANRVDERKCTFCDYSETKEVEGTILPKIVRALSLKPIANRTFDGLEKPVLESDLVLIIKKVASQLNTGQREQEHSHPLLSLLKLVHMNIESL